MRGNRTWIENKILMILDKSPCHGYELHLALPEEAQKVKLTTLYRWLHDMEIEALVESEMKPGPHGPLRRVYQLGPRGETRLREVLKDSVENVLHFYDAYRHSITKDVYDKVGREVLADVEGRVLYSAFPRITRHDLALVRMLVDRCTSSKIEVIGNCEILERTGIAHKSVKGEIQDIRARNERYSEIWLSGVPDRNILPRVVAECKRVLAPGGRLQITAPFIFFDEPKQSGLGEFIRVSSTYLFPDLGIVEGQEVGSVIESNFVECGAFETFPNLVEFWAVKETSD
ncbi:MAG: helix-turn-helix transcriptional regulator [Candidatus Thorarchaeota archaeon]